MYQDILLLRPAVPLQCVATTMSREIPEDCFFLDSHDVEDCYEEPENTSGDEIPKSVSDSALTFQILEVQVENSAAPSVDISNTSVLFLDNAYRPSQDGSGESKQRAFNKKGPSVVYVFGITEEGHSVCAAVTGFRPWMFVEVTPMINKIVLESVLRDIESKCFRLPQDTIRVEYVRKKKVYGWVPISLTDASDVKQFLFAQVFFPTMAALRAANALLEAHNLKQSPVNLLSTEQAEKLKSQQFTLDKMTSLSSVHEKFVISESKVQASEKFLACRGLVSSSWVTISKTMVEDVPLDQRVTISQLEVTCNMSALSVVENMNKAAPMLIAAVDIEVQSSDYCSFPDAGKVGDVCTFIGTTFWMFGDKVPRMRVMQVLGSCDPVEGIVIESYDNEMQLLNAWRDLIAIRSNPDTVVSYNGTGFDFAYLSRRFDFHRANQESLHYSRFTHLSRFLFQSSKLEKRSVSSAGMGQNEISEFPMAGRLQLDLFQYIKNSQKLSSYKLDDVCETFLGKESGKGKIVLDFPGWVRETTIHAVAQLKYGCEQVMRLLPVKTASCDSDASLTSPSIPSEKGVQVMNAVTNLKARCFAQCILAQSRVDEVVLETSAVRIDLEESLKWSGVYDALDTAKDDLVKMIEMVNDVASKDFRMEMQSILSMQVQLALDASGSDNYRKLFRMYDCSPAHRAAIAAYCQVDCDLVLMLMDRLNVIPNMIQMSQVTYTLLNDIFSRGQQIKTFNLIARHCFRDGFVMNFENVGWDPLAEYEGATVLPPVTGYYERPVVTLDFASLYPSIMQAYNLCFSSIVLDDQYGHMEEHGARYGRYDIAGKVWTFQEHSKGLLPKILEFLVNERRACKKEMKNFEKSSLDYKLADGKQLALKVSCNSVYGFTGAMNHGMFPCMPVAVATTFNGRQLINQTKLFVETTYGASVVYGDTDSVMLQFPGVNTVEQAFAIAGRVARECSATFREVLSLEFEKVYFPYLLIKKKHYAGMKYEDNPSHPPVLDAKGLALVRRDNCQLVRTTMRDVLHATMRDRNPLRAYNIVKDQIRKLVDKQVDLKDLEISNFYKKGLQNDHHPHIQVVKNMTARQSFGVPRVGDRVPYVIIEGARNSQIYQRAEHPKYVTDAGLKIDLEYYLRNQLQSRLEKVLMPLPVPSVIKLFNDASAEIMRVRQGLRRLDSFFVPVHPRTLVSAPESAVSEVAAVSYQAMSGHLPLALDSMCSEMKTCSPNDLGGRVLPGLHVAGAEITSPGESKLPVKMEGTRGSSGSAVIKVSSRQSTLWSGSGGNIQVLKQHSLGEIAVVPTNGGSTIVKTKKRKSVADSKGKGDNKITQYFNF